MTYEPGSRPPKPRTLGPAGWVAMFLAVPAGFALAVLGANVGAGPAVVLAILAVAVAVALVRDRRPLPRAIGTGLLGGYAIALLLVGACALVLIEIGSQL